MRTLSHIHSGLAFRLETALAISKSKCCEHGIVALDVLQTLQFVVAQHFFSVFFKLPKKKMVRTRSGQVPITFDPPVNNPVRPLLKRHLRDGGTDDPHSCPICHDALAIRETLPKWMQCPTCGEVVCEGCMLSYIARCDDTFRCVNCRAVYSRDSIEYEPEAWSADAAIEALNGDYSDSYQTSSGDESSEGSSGDESSGDESSGDESSGDESSDDESSDDESSGEGNEDENNMTA